MNKVKILGALLFILLMAGMAQAAGTVTVAGEQYFNPDVYVITWTVTADASDGTVPATAAPSFIGYLYYVKTIPGATGPTADYDITLTGPDGDDVLGGAAANRSDTLTQTVAPLLTDGSHYAPFISGPLTLNVTNNAVLGATFTVIAVLTK